MVTDLVHQLTQFNIYLLQTSIFPLHFLPLSNLLTALCYLNRGRAAKFASLNHINEKLFMKILNLYPLAVLLALFFSPSASTAAEWQIKQGPMMTKWAENIDPSNVMPEYPRPQMQRDEWMNLNGLWDLRKGTIDEPYSATFSYDKEILVPSPSSRPYRA